MPKCQDVGCPSTPITDHDWHRRGVSEVLQNNRDHVGSSFHYEGHHWNPLADSCIKKGKEREKRRKEHKASKPNKQKEKKKAQTKITEHGGGNEIRKDKTLNDICRKLVSRISTPRKYTRSCPIPITHKRDIISLHIGQPDTPRREVTYRERLGRLSKCWKPHSDR